MSNQHLPTVGRIVHYTLTEHDAEMINVRRRDGAKHIGEHGRQIHTGNNAASGQIYPMLITRTWGTDQASAVNGQVFLDGNDSLWVTSVKVGDGQGTFAWPTQSYSSRIGKYEDASAVRQ